MSEAVQVGIDSTTATVSHEKLLSQDDLTRYDEALGDIGLDFTYSDDQEYLVEWFEGMFEEEPSLAPVGASAADVAIEFLLIGKGLVASEVSRKVMCHPEANSARRLHVVREAHEHREDELRQERQQRLHAQAQLNFVAPSIAS